MLAADLPRSGQEPGGLRHAGRRRRPDTVEVERIRARVAAALPDYMTPAAYVVLDEIPITAHGKIDRAALPEPEIAARRRIPRPDDRPPNAASPHCFPALLGHDRVGVDDSFFDLGRPLAGGHQTGHRHPLGLWGRAGYPRRLRARHGRPAGRAGRPAADPVSRAQARPKLIATAHDEPPRPQPLSASQLRSWFAYRVDGPSWVNNIPFAAKLTGPWDIDALIAAVGDVVARHEILRTTYVELPTACPTRWSSPSTELAVRRATRATAMTGCRSNSTPSAGTASSWTANGRFGSPCCTPATRGRARAVAGGPSHRLRPLVGGCAVRRRDHRVPGPARRGSPVLGAAACAVRRLRGVAGDVPGPEPAAVKSPRLPSSSGTTGRPSWPGCRRTPGCDPTSRASRCPAATVNPSTFRIDSATRAKLAELCRELGITEFMLLQTAVAVVLHKAGGGVDIPLGTPVAGRTEAELDQLIGFFVNILVLRNDLTGNPTLRELLSRARETALAAYAHQDLPFDRVVDSVSPVRSLSRNPLFQVVVHVRDHLPATRVIESAPEGGGEDTVCTSLDPVFDMAHADLSVNFFGTDGSGDTGYNCNLIFRTELYQQGHHRAVGRLADSGRHRVCRQRRPDFARRAVDRRRRAASDIWREWSRGEQPPHDRPRTIPELLQPADNSGSDRIAVRCGDEQIDYPALHRRSDNLAALLAGRGVGPGSLVGLSSAAEYRPGGGAGGDREGRRRATSRSIPAIRRRASNSCSTTCTRRSWWPRSKPSTACPKVLVPPWFRWMTRRCVPSWRTGHRSDVGRPATAAPRRPDVSGLHVRIDWQAEGSGGHPSIDGGPAGLAAAALSAQSRTTSAWRRPRSRSSRAAWRCWPASRPVPP